jgi:hypothetical protein
MTGNVVRVGVETEGSLCQSGNLKLNRGVLEVHRLQEATMFYVGLDIHDKRIAICRFNSPVPRSAPITSATTLIVFPPAFVSVLWIGPRSGPN